MMACPGVVPLMGRSLVDGDGALAKIEVLDAQAHGFHKAKATAIHDLGDQFPRIFKAGENGADFLAGHHDGRAALSTRWSDMIQGEFFHADDVFHEEDHGVEGLLPGGWRYVPFQREEVEVGSDGGGPMACGDWPSFWWQ
jgi:hypothetical protein